MIDLAWTICPDPCKYRCSLTRRLGCHDWPTFGQVHTPSLWLGGMRKQQHIFESHFSVGFQGEVVVILPRRRGGVIFGIKG